MSHKRYYMADDCPNCGQQDKEWEWKGARMGSTTWGHDYMCCSETCGVAFATSPVRREMERKSIQLRISILKDQLSRI